MFNNFSYKKFTVSGGPTNFIFNQAGNTVRMQAAIQAWADTGATVVEVEPDPGNDGKFFVGYKVTNPSPNVWHYEYAIFNMNLDRAIQSFDVPAINATISNTGFHAPPQHPGWANDGTFNNQGYSSAPWTVTGVGATWSCETFAQNQNANAIRWGTLYNFRFDADLAPAPENATIGFFKTGAPVTVQVEVPEVGGPTPTPTPIPPTPTPTPTPSATPTATPSATPRATPRPRPTPHPRP
jgi:hypothetical protein